MNKSVILRAISQPHCKPWHSSNACNAYPIAVFYMVSFDGEDVMLRIAVLFTGVIMVLNLNAAEILTTYSDYILAGLVAMMLQPWVINQFD